MMQYLLALLTFVPRASIPVTNPVPTRLFKEVCTLSSAACRAVAETNKKIVSLKPLDAFLIQRCENCCRQPLEIA